MLTTAATLAHAWDHDLQPVFGYWQRTNLSAVEHTGWNSVTRAFPKLMTGPFAYFGPSTYLIRERDHTPTARPLRHVPGRDRMLDGLFSDEKYFVRYRSRLLDAFGLSPRRTQRLREKYAAVLEGATVSVSVRRGEYAWSGQQVLRRLDLEPEWYQRALELVPSVDRVVVFSDEPEWCREHLVLDHPLTVVAGNRAEEDLILMSWCDHHVIPNSTFAWWGAWLDPNPSAVVVQPERWVTDLGRERLGDWNCGNPTGWIRL